MLRFCAHTILIALAAPSLVLAANPARYMARLQDGTVIEGNTLSDWHGSKQIPRLENQPLLEPSNPFRWLIDRSLSPPQEPEAYLEFVTGDRLPGVVQGYRTGNEFPYAPQPPHLLVTYSNTNSSNLEPQLSTLRIDVRAIRRIVWRRRVVETAEPATVLLTGGSTIRFRSIRFGSSGATLLTASGVRRVAYAELAELQMPTVDFWPLAFDELAALSPSGQARLLQLDTIDGLVATSSLDRYLPRVVGDSREVHRWVHGIQPAWSLDTIWVPQGRVWARRSFASHEVPLSRVPVKRFEQRSPLGDVRFPLAVNRNVLGGALRGKAREAGWGLGVHAFAEIEYELPPETNALRTEFAIDAAMNDGGCVKPRVVNSAAGGGTLWEGPVLVGNHEIVNSGALSLAGDAAAPRRISLQVDPVLNDRPRGADPFDIRDNANWLEPMVELDATRLQRTLDERVLRIQPALRDWTAMLESGSQATWSNFYAEGPGNTGEFAPEVNIQSGALKLTLNRKLSEDDRWLVVDAVRTQSSGAASKVEIRFGDQKPTEYELPIYDKSRTDFRPIVLPLKTVANAAGAPIEIRLLPAENTSVYWRSVLVATQHPMLFRWFEDDVPATSNSAASLPTITNGTLDDQQKQFGARSLVFTKDKQLIFTSGAPLTVHERPQLGQYRFLRFAVRKQGGGALRIQIQQSSGDENAKYETGPRPANDLGARYLTDGPLKDEWQVFTRDLFGDFGNMDIAALKFEIPDGSQAWIDHVYLARTQNDFDLVKVNH